MLIWFIPIFWQIQHSGKQKSTCFSRSVKRCLLFVQQKRTILECIPKTNLLLEISRNIEVEDLNIKCNILTSTAHPFLWFCCVILWWWSFNCVTKHRSSTYFYKVLALWICGLKILLILVWKISFVPTSKKWACNFQEITALTLSSLL